MIHFFLWFDLNFIYILSIHSSNWFLANASKLGSHLCLDISIHFKEKNECKPFQNPKHWGYIKASYIFFLSDTFIHNIIQWKRCNLPMEMLQSCQSSWLNLLNSEWMGYEIMFSFLNFKWDMKLYFLSIKFNEVETALKHPKTFHSKNISKR